MRKPQIVNETQYDGRTVGKIVRWVFRELDLNGLGVMVKVKHHNGSHAYQGRFYSNAHANDFVYDYNLGDWKEIRMNVPLDVRHLVICRIGKEGVYPKACHLYERKSDMPEPWVCEDWQQALVSVTAHEATHLAQHRKRKPYREQETEWAAFRLWRRWTR